MLTSLTTVPGLYCISAKRSARRPKPFRSSWKVGRSSGVQGRTVWADFEQTWTNSVHFHHQISWESKNSNGWRYLVLTNFFMVLLWQKHRKFWSQFGLPSCRFFHGCSPPHPNSHPWPQCPFRPWLRSGCFRFLVPWHTTKKKIWRSPIFRHNS